MRNKEINIAAVDPATLIERKREQPISTEKYDIFFDAITISGVPGTGKTTFGKELARSLGLEYHKPSEIQRDFHLKSTGEEVVGAHKRPANLDTAVDADIKFLISQKKGHIIEGHRANIIAFDEAPFTTLRIVLDVQNENTSYARVQERENKKIKLQNEERKTKGLDPLPELTIEDVRQKTMERTEENRKIWNDLYPDSSDPYDIYNGALNVYIDTEQMEVSEVVGGFIKYLEEEKWILPLSGQIYPTP